MAKILKEGYTYITPQGIPLSNVYGAIDSITNRKRDKEADVNFHIYPSKTLADTKKNGSLIENCAFIIRNWKETVDDQEIEHNDYDDYMSPAAVTADDNSFKQAYLYLNNKEKSIGGFVFNDWQNDE